MFPVIEWAQFWAQSVSTAHARENPAVSSCSKAYRRRRSPILCLELCPLPSVARSLTNRRGPTRKTNLQVCGFRAQAASVDATRRAYRNKARRRIRKALELFVDDARTAMMEDNGRRQT